MNSEPLTEKHDFSDLAININKQFSYKIAFILFFIYIIIHSDLFVENVLGNLSSKLHDKNDPTDLGILVQGIMVVLAYIVLSIIRETL